MAIAPFGPLHFRAAEGSGFTSVALTELDGTTPVATFDADGDTAPIVVSSPLGYVAFWAEPGTYQLQFTRSDEDDPIVETIDVDAPTAPEFEPSGLSTDTFAALDTRYQLTDGGSTQQWLLSTPAERGSIWSYNGIIYERIVSGTDSTFVRANWVALGVDPSYAAGGELAATPQTSGWSQAMTVGNWYDITGANAAPIIPSNGRGVYCEFDYLFTSTVASNGVSVRLFDVTANAIALRANGGSCLFWAVGLPTTTAAVPLHGVWRLAPAAGSRTYKIQVAPKLNGTIGVLGLDTGFEGLLRFIAR